MNAIKYLCWKIYNWIAHWYSKHAYFDTRPNINNSVSKLTVCRFGTYLFWHIEITGSKTQKILPISYLSLGTYN